MTGFPDGPIAAVTHPDPYPYYADLVAHRPLYHDPTLGMWVASSAEVVTAILASEHCQVRPPGDAVLAALRGTPAGQIFSHMVRFTDGPGHCPLKAAVSRALATVTATQAAAQSAAWARSLAQEIAPTRDPARLSLYAYHLPVYVAASLLGVPPEMLPQTTTWAAEFARCLAPGSTPDQVARGSAAAAHLLDTFATLARTPPTQSAHTLLDHLAQETIQSGFAGLLSTRAAADTISTTTVSTDTASEDVIIANAIGFLFQAYDATAGLIGNTLLALAHNPTEHARVVGDPALLPELIAEVLRHDPPVQNTRRFVAQPFSIAGRNLQPDDAILVILAAASRDPEANPNPHQFELARPNRQTFTFGAAAHACPGAPLATTIASAALTQLLTSGADPQHLTLPPTYRPTQNLRIALAPRAGSA